MTILLEKGNNLIKSSINNFSNLSSPKYPGLMAFYLLIKLPKMALPCRLFGKMISDPYCTAIHFKQTGFPVFIRFCVSVSKPVFVSLLNITISSLF